jgi:hypothetical protein
MRTRLLCWLLGALTLAMAARAEEGTLLRYKWVEGQQTVWSMSTFSHGKVTSAKPEGTETTDLKIHGSIAMFSQVEKVTPEGLAHLKVSFGLMAFDTELPNGTKVHTELNWADNTVVTTAGGERQVTKLPEGANDLLSKGFIAVLDDRGQVKEILGNEKLQGVLASMAGGGGVNPEQIVSWLEPVLPERAVKPGDGWEIDLPLGQLLGQPSSKPVVIKFRYEGDEKVGDVMCRRFHAEAQATDLTLTIPPGLTTNGLKTQISGFSMQMAADYYVSVADTHVVVARTAATENGTVHVEGTMRVGDQDINVDQTTVLDGFKVEAEIRRM